MNTSGGRVDIWLFRSFAISATLLLCFGCYLAWRISMVAYRTEQSIASLSSDLEEVTGSAVKVARKVDELMVRVTRLETAVKDKYRRHKGEVDYLKTKVREIQEGGQEAMKKEAREAAAKLLRRGKDYLREKLQESKEPVAGPDEEPVETLDPQPKQKDQ